jgi:hypothetical protein
MPIHAQVVQQLKKYINIGAGFYPDDAFGSHIDANFLDHELKPSPLLHKRSPVLWILNPHPRVYRSPNRAARKKSSSHRWMATQQMRQPVA